MNTLIVGIAIQAIVTAPADHQERLEFVGFSKAEDTATWRVWVEQPTPDGHTDRFQLIRVVDCTTGERIGHIRQGRATRVDRLGRRARLTPPERIASENPIWQQALPARVWKKAKRRTRFRHKRIELDDSAIQFVPHPDAHMTARRDGNTMTFSGDPGSPIGFDLEARLFDGRQVNMGRVRVRGVPNRAVNASLHFFLSPSGHHVAYRVRVSSDTPGYENRFDFDRVVRFPDRPLGVNTIGTFRVLREHAKLTADRFGEMHPGQQGLYESYVGPW